MKKFLLVVGALCFVSGIWGMDGGDKKTTQEFKKEERKIDKESQRKPLFDFYDLEFVDREENKNIIRVQPDAFGLGWYFMEYEREYGDQEKLMKNEGGKKILIVKSLILPQGVTLEDADALIKYAQTQKKIEWKDEQLLGMILIADKFIITKRQKGDFAPHYDVLDVLLVELADRLEKMEKQILLSDFRKHQGLAGEIITRLPEGLQRKLRARMSDAIPMIELKHGEEVASLIELKDGRLVSGGFGPSIKIWKQGKDGKFVLDDTVGWCHSRVISPVIELKDGRLASGFGDKTIKILKQGKDGKFVLDDTLPEQNNGDHLVIELKDGRLASRSIDGVIKIWKPGKDGKFVLENTLGVLASLGIYSMIELKDGRLVSGGFGPSIKIWKQGKDGKFVLDDTVRGPSKLSIFSMVELKDGRLASGTGNGTILIWKPGKDGRFVLDDTVRGYTDSVNSLIELKDGRLISESADGAIKILKQGKNGKFVVKSTVYSLMRRYISPFNLSSSFVIELKDGRLALLFYNDGIVRICDIASMSFTQYMVMRLLSEGSELFDEPMQKPGSGGYLKSYFVKTNPVVLQQSTEQEQWYKKLFEDELILNTFTSLPEASLAHLIQLKGVKVVRIAIEMLLDGIQEDMEEEEYIDQHQKEIIGRLDSVLRLLRVLNLTEQEWELDPLVGYYKQAKKMAVVRKALQDEQRKLEKNEKVEKVEEKK